MVKHAQHAPAHITLGAVLSGVRPRPGRYSQSARRLLRQRPVALLDRQPPFLDGMAGVGVPIFDAAGRVAAAFSVGTLAARLSGERLPVVVGLLQKEAQALASQINPFDRSLRRPAEALRMAGSTPN